MHIQNTSDYMETALHIPKIRLIGHDELKPKANGRMLRSVGELDAIMERGKYDGW